MLSGPLLFPDGFVSCAEAARFAQADIVAWGSVVNACAPCSSWEPCLHLLLKLAGRSGCKVDL